jgi:protein SCO1/2
MKNILVVFLALFLSTLSYGSGDKIGAYERLGNHVPLDLVYTNELGQKKTLGEFMDGKPTIISVNYFHCPGICGPQIDSLTKSLDKIGLIEGKEYKALTISFVTTDTAKDAMIFKKNHVHLIKDSFDKSAWNFLVSDDQKTIDTLTKAFGYEYKKIVNKQGFTDYIHPTALIVLAPDGKITRYLEGIQYLPVDLKMALLEAAQGKVRPTITRALAFCYSFDPESSKYIVEYKKIFGVVSTFFLIVIFLYFLITGKKTRKGDSK